MEDRAGVRGRTRKPARVRVGGVVNSRARERETGRQGAEGVV